MSSGPNYKPRKRPQQARSSVTYDAILDAAAQVLTNEGYVAANTNKIAERAGVSIGSVYEYFPSKESIFAALIERTDLATADVVIQHLNDTSKLSPREFLRAVLNSRIAAALAHPELESTLRAEIPASLFYEQDQITLERFAAAVMDFTSKNQDHIRLRNLEVALEFGTLVVESTVRAFSRSSPNRLANQEFVHEFEDMMLRYILKVNDAE